MIKPKLRAGECDGEHDGGAFLYPYSVVGVFDISITPRRRKPMCPCLPRVLEGEIGLVQGVQRLHLNAFYWSDRRCFHHRAVTFADAFPVPAASPDVMVYVSSLYVSF